VRCRFSLIALMVLASFLRGQGGQERRSSSTPSKAEADKERILWHKLEQRVAEINRRLDGVLGVAILDLTNGHRYLLNGDEVFPQASTIKIPLLLELYRQSQDNAQGQAKLTDLYIVSPSDLVPDSDILLGLTPGVTRLTNRDLATIVMAVSDNSATNILIERVGMDNVNQLMDRLGLKRTRLRRKMMDLKAAKEGRENVSTPREMMLLFEAIYREKVLNKASTEGFLKVLSTHKESAMLRGLPDGVRAANKPGALEGVRNDSGIIFVENRPFILCIMATYLQNEKAGEKAISEIAALAYAHFEALGRASPYGRVISPGNSGSDGRKRNVPP
jgi:beta-lactamase class A